MQTPQDIERKMHIARDLADACGLVLDINNEAQKKEQQITALAQQVEQLTKTVAERDAQVKGLTEQLAQAKLDQGSKGKK